MGDVVNLNERRKRKAREQKEADSAAKRILFGRTKGEKQRESKERSADIRKLDGARREKPARDADKAKD
ncbi:MAG TPA: DUF4169 family protein [Hyphomonadaceae bacterium]|nr:DUF4169 family protein [Hyphomonadaceae bacterium]